MAAAKKSTSSQSKFVETKSIRNVSSHCSKLFSFLIKLKTDRVMGKKLFWPNLTSIYRPQKNQRNKNHLNIHSRKVISHVLLLIYRYQAYFLPLLRAIRHVLPLKKGYFSFLKRPKIPLKRIVEIRFFYSRFQTD